MPNEQHVQEVTASTLRVILIAVEYGYKGCEHGKNLEQVLQEVCSFYKVKDAN